jgi:hypothetical protein
LNIHGYHGNDGYFEILNLNAYLHIPRIIPVKFHYDRIQICFNIYGYNGNCSHYINVKPKCTSTHSKDHSCKVSLQSDRKNVYWAFMITMGTVAILKIFNLECTSQG